MISKAEVAVSEKELEQVLMPMDQIIHKPENAFSIRNCDKDPMISTPTKPSSVNFLNTYLLQEQ